MTRTFLLGIDGLPSWMWRKFADSGVMPYSAELLKTGVLAPMESALPEVSSAAWASIVTGQDPSGHNVYGFTDLIDGTYSLGFTSARTLKAKPFWQEDDGRRNLIINVPQSYPAQPLNGALISGFLALDLERAVFPPENVAGLQEMGYRIDADMTTINESKDRFLENIHQVLDTRFEAFSTLWDAEPWDRIMFVITGTDRLNHYLWEDYQDTSSPYHQKFLDFYSHVDRIIEQIMAKLPDETALAVMADHGFEHQEMSVNVNCLLREHGFLSLKDSPRPAYTQMTTQTKAFAMDPGRLYLHRKDRYPHGTLDNDAAELAAEELTTLFLGLEVEGKKLVDRVLRGSDIYHGPFAHRAPDLILMAAEGVALSGRMNLEHLIEPVLINGKHTFENSTFFARGLTASDLPETMRVQDVLSVLKMEKQQRIAA